MNCLFEAADALAAQPESARTVAEAAYGSCGNEEVALEKSTRAFSPPLEFEKLKTDVLTPKLLARVMAIRAAIAKLKDERGKERTTEPSPAIEYNRM